MGKLYIPNIVIRKGEDQGKTAREVPLNKISVGDELYLKGHLPLTVIAVNGIVNIVKFERPLDSDYQGEAQVLASVTGVDKVVSNFLQLYRSTLRALANYRRITQFDGQTELALPEGNITVPTLARITKTLKAKAESGSEADFSVGIEIKNNTAQPGYLSAGAVISLIFPESDAGYAVKAARGAINFLSGERSANYVAPSSYTPLSDIIAIERGDGKARYLIYDIEPLVPAGDPLDIPDLVVGDPDGVDVILLPEIPEEIDLGVEVAFQGNLSIPESITRVGPLTPPAMTIEFFGAYQFDLPESITRVGPLTQPDINIKHTPAFHTSLPTDVSEY